MDTGGATYAAAEKTALPVNGDGIVPICVPVNPNPPSAVLAVR